LTFRPEILQIIALASEDDQIIRPVFPNQQQMMRSAGASGGDGGTTDEAYNLQLLSVHLFYI
jgi:hypothetical protein